MNQAPAFYVQMEYMMNSQKRKIDRSLHWIVFILIKL